MNRITAADYHDLVGVSEPRVAPDGDRVAFVRSTPEDDEHREATVYVAPTGGGEPRRLTVAEGVDTEPRWSPDGDRLAVVSTRGDGDRPQLWVLPTDGGEARRVTDAVGGVSGVAWSPDGSRIAFTQRVTPADREADRDLNCPPGYERDPPDPRVVDRTVYRSAEEYADGRRAQVYLADLETDRVERVTTAAYDHTAPEWGDDRTLYYARADGDPDPDDSNRHTIVASDTATGQRERLHATTGWDVSLAATADGRVAYTHVEDDRATLRPVEARVYDTADGTVHRPTAGLDRTLSADRVLQWGPDEESLYVLTPDEGAVTLWRVPWDLQPEDAAPAGADAPRRVVREEWSSIDGVHVGRVVALVHSEWDHPGDVYVTTPGGAERRRLTRVNADYLDDRAVARPEEIRFESDGHEIQGWLLTPPDAGPEASAPLVVEVHGGPHAMWTTSGTMWHEFQTLAARGYAVFWCNPRGSTGYGADFAAANEGDWGAVTAADVLAGVDAVADRDDVGDQTFLTGGSFGGFMTGWLVGTTDRFDAAVAQRGVYDLTGFYGSTDEAYKLVEDDFGTTPWADPAFLWERSPVGRAHRVETPTLVVHADDDYRTPACTAELFHRILRKHGVDTRLVRYPDEGHELSRSGQPGHIVDRIERIARWFDGYATDRDAAPATERERGAGLSRDPRGTGGGDTPE